MTKNLKHIGRAQCPLSRRSAHQEHFLLKSPDMRQTDSIMQHDLTEDWREQTLGDTRGILMVGT